ncbi:MAG: stage VI sporulation protein F [Bacteroidia bacterium]|nr:stage VI sporulation protein F [Bacteroidia bacterium]
MTLEQIITKVNNYLQSNVAENISAAKLRELCNDIATFADERVSQAQIDEIIESIVSVNQNIDTKADLVDGKVPLTQLPEVVNTNKRLLSGGIMYAGTGMNWDYTQLVYEWASSPQIVPASTEPITLSDGDGDYSRIDAVCINSVG